jgi:fibronectin type 3 domain-containing protein
MGEKKEVKTREFIRVLLLSVILIMAGLSCRSKVSFSNTSPATSPLSGPPEAPASVDAIQGNAQAAISWGSVSNATSYNLYWSTSSVVTPANGTKITSVASPYTHTGLTNGTTYYYIVTAVNSYGESPASNQVSATPSATGLPPAAPIGVKAVPGNTQATISWSPVYGATSYNLYWSNTSGVTPGNGTKIASVASPYIHTGLISGTTYYYIVTAVNSYGESPASNQVSATPPISSSEQTSVINTLPWEGARLIPLNPSIIINFSNPLSQSNSGMIITLASLPSAQIIAGQAGIQSNYLYFTPSTSLMPLSYYRFTLSGTLYDENNSQVLLPAQGLTFSFETQANNTPMASVAPVLVNIFPSLPGQVFTNTVFRLTFSQPISQSSISYGNDIRIIDTTAAANVPVTLVPVSNNIVLQPVLGLSASHTYQLLVTNQIAGINAMPVLLNYNGLGNGNTFSYTFTPVSAGPLMPLTVQLDPAVQLDSAGNITNMNNVNAGGVPVNVNIVNSQLIGPSTAYLTGYLTTYMGNAVANTPPVPIIIPGGQRLDGSTLSVNLGGVIPTPLSSKKLSITLLDNGAMYMSGSPYQDINPQAPPIMYGIEDLNLTAQDPVTNAVLNQNLMGVQLTGTISIDKTDGSMVMNFMGIADLNIMGIEQAPVILFLRFKTVPNGWVAPQGDNTFVATGTIPYRGDGRIGTDSSFIVNFSGPVDPGNLAGMFNLSPLGATITYQTIYNGSSIIVTPYNAPNPFYPIPLVPKTPYSLTVSTGLTSVMGTSTNQNAVFSFTTDAQENGGGTTPAVATVFPENNGYLPLFAHAYISLDHFINPTSVVYNSNVFVRDVTAGNTLVTGGIKVTGKKILFIPSQPLVNGHQYTFGVNSSVADIDGNTLGQSTTINFTAQATPWFPILSQVLSPVADRNQNSSIDGSEITTPTNEILMGQTTILGLPLVPQSPSYLSGSLNALVTGIVNVNGNPQMRFVVDDGAVLFGTNVNIVAAGLISLSTGRLTLSLGSLTSSQAQGWSCGTRPACGYIAYNTSAQQLTAVTYMATTATASNTATEAMMSPYQPVKVVLSGPVTFLPDGRLALTMSGKTTMTVGLLGITANIPTTIYTRIVSTMPSAWN